MSEKGSDGVWCCRAGGMSSARMGRPGGCWAGKARISSLCPSPHLCGFSRMLDPFLVERLPSTHGSPGEELVMSNLTQLRMGNAGSGEGLNGTTRTAATHGGNSSSPSALPWLSVSQVPLKQMMSLGELLVASPFYDLPTHFFNSNHNGEVMKP